jgi:DNA repair exonuclease SbcCD nuclease subunit
VAFRFFHAADLHLDSPLRGLERYEGAPVDEIRGATRRALENLVSQALEERVAFVVIAGDVYDGDWKDYNTGLYFAGQMVRLRDAGIAVYLVSGNHDAASQITRALRLPDNVHAFPTDRPATVKREELGVALHGQGFAQAEVTTDLSADFPAPVPGMFNIGVLHTSATGRPGHHNYAPCKTEGLVAKGYDYWALGHIHQREVLHQNPWVVFPGNLQGRHARETGAKGATLVTVDGGVAAGVEHRVLDVVRWLDVTVDAGAQGEEEVDPWDLPAVAAAQVERAADEAGVGERLAAVRLRAVVPRDLREVIEREPGRWKNEIRLAVASSAGGSRWIEKVEVSSAAAGGGPGERGSGPGGDELLMDLLGSSGLAGGGSGETVEEVGRPLLQKLPERIRAQLDEDAGRVIDDARALIEAEIRASSTGGEGEGR